MRDYIVITMANILAIYVGFLLARSNPVIEKKESNDKLARVKQFLSKDEEAYDPSKGE